MRSADVLGYYALPLEHRGQIWPTNSLEGGWACPLTSSSKTARTDDYTGP